MIKSISVESFIHQSDNCRDKSRYQSKHLARQAAKHALKHSGVVLRIYLCPVCERYHLTKSNKI